MTDIKQRLIDNEDFFKNQTEQQNDVYLKVKFTTGRSLDQTELNIIENVYIKRQSDSIKNVGLYRLVNFFIGILFLIISLLFQSSNLILIIWGLFTAINLILGIVAKIKHRSFVLRNKNVDD